MEVLARAQVPVPTPSKTSSNGPPQRATPVERALATTLAEVLGVESVAVDADFFDDLGADSMMMAQFCARVRKREELPSISIKDVYAHSTVRSLATALAPAAVEPASAAVETALAEVLADVLHTERVAPDADFFDDLGADSMMMAQFCARVRKRDDLPSVSIKEVYAHPTVRGLAAALAEPASGPAAPAAVVPAAPAEPYRASTLQYVLSGAVQFLVFIGYSYGAASIFAWSFDWISTGGGLFEDYLRAVEASAATFCAISVTPIVVKWVLIGRWKPRQIPVWTPGYLRFWLVRTLVMANPLVLFAGSPIYNLYLRALGAKIGRGAVILTRHAPVCADLLTVGAGAVVRKDTYLNCYRAHSGWIQIGPVTIGKDAFVGDKAVLDIGTAVGDGAQLGHASALHPGQAVSAGERWHGSPAQPTDADYRRIAPARCRTGRRVGYAGLQALALLLGYLPAGFGGLAILLGTVPQLEALTEPRPLALETGSFYVFALVLSFSIFFGGIVVRFLFAVAASWVLAPLLEPDRVYPLYGFRYSVHRTMLHVTNSKFFVGLTGDTSYIVGYLRSIGYKLAPVVQTGSNFGMEVKHEFPQLTSVGRGTVVASGLSVLNATYSSTSFRVSRAAIGANNFLGNDIVYPAESKAGDNCLLASKVLVPIDGEVREGVGLLGSPAFEIPRSVARDSEFIRMAHDEDFPRRLAAKNRYNLRTIGLSLLARWIYFFVLTVVGLTGLDLLDEWGPWALAAANLAILLFSVVYFCSLECAATRFLGIRPLHCSIYEIDFWRRERFFKFTARMGVHRLAAGTPFAALLWRVVGVRLGKRLFDDGHSMAEKVLITIGDDVTLNAGSYIQVHTQEDYAFKSDATTVGSGCTFGVGAMAHYGVTLGDGVALAAESFVMKGEEVPPHAHWGGNPARELRPDELARAAAVLAPPAGRPLVRAAAGNGSTAAAPSGDGAAPTPRPAPRFRGRPRAERPHEPHVASRP